VSHDTDFAHRNFSRPKLAQFTLHHPLYVYSTKHYSERRQRDPPTWLRRLAGAKFRHGGSLYLIHWPKPRQNAYIEAWKALVKLKEEGKAKSIGVSNFTVSHLKRIVDATGVVPSINQIELHPGFQQEELTAYHAEHGIITESWSPLGQGTLLESASLKALGQKHGKTPAQVIIRWHLDRGYIVIPKSVAPSRIRENFDVFDFSLDADDLAKIAALDRKDGRIGPDPQTADF
jgi:2,5-diketo-D-gluconate reductase A